MLSDFIYKKSSAEYSNRILLRDEDNLDEQTSFTSVFEQHGFEVIYYTDDLSFRLQHENKLQNDKIKIVLVTKKDSYVPYDILKQFSECNVSIASLFPKLNIQAVIEKTDVNLDLISIAYENSYEDYKNYKDAKQFIDQTVYSFKNVELYVSEAYKKCLKDAENCKSYDGWIKIAEKKAKIDILSVKHEIEVDISEINAYFQKYILSNFGKLSSEINSEFPVLVSQAMEYISDNSKKFVLIVMDGMSEFDWEIISQSFNKIKYHRNSSFAMIPTITSISRQCLLSGKYPIQLKEPWKQSKEEKEFIECAENLGFSRPQISYQRGYDADFSSLIKCGAVIINDVDDMVHGQQQGRIGMFNDINLMAKQHKLANMVKRFLSSGFDVYISADHGNTLCKGMGKLINTGVETETKSHRMIVLRDIADKEALKSKYDLIDFPKYYLFKEFDYLICKNNCSFDAKNAIVMSHGGITIDEVMVPFIKIRVEENNV